VARVDPYGELMGRVVFITGGARSGKSQHAERLAADSGRAVVFIATMEPLDDELVLRVARHRANRPDAWLTVEAPRDLLPAMDLVPVHACALVDCLSLWVANRLLEYGDQPAQRDLDALEQQLDDEVDALLARAEAREAPTILVSNEVGAGVVPDSPLGRAYRDLLGRVNQRVSMAASEAWLLVAGRALALPAPSR
jgi:adenosylcobinamide kinase/adenosylcobinamide-phosphate guanylyltransferase